MKKVNKIDEIIAIEKARSIEYDYEFDKHDEKIFAKQLKKLFDKYELDANNLYGVYLFDEEDITDSEYMMIRIEDIFIVVYLEWIADVVSFVVFDN